MTVNIKNLEDQLSLAREEQKQSKALVAEAGKAEADAKQKAETFGKKMQEAKSTDKGIIAQQEKRLNELWQAYDTAQELHTQAKAALSTTSRNIAGLIARLSTAREREKEAAVAKDAGLQAQKPAAPVVPGFKHAGKDVQSGHSGLQEGLKGKDKPTGNIPVRK